jgi:hypothetical protein
MSMTRWMSWEGGVDLAGFTAPGLAAPNLVVHVGRMVHSPAGHAPAGLVLWQPEPRSAPAVMGFVCEDDALARYFGPQIFAGTPFEHAPCLRGIVRVFFEGNACGSRVEVEGHVFETTLHELGPLEVVNRPQGALPFHQQGLEAVPQRVSVKVDGRALDVIVPPVGMSGGPAVAWSPCGSYSR